MVGSKEALDSSVTSSGDATTTGDSTNNPNSISRHRREVLIRQPSYCKILDDLQGTEERVLKLANKMPTKGQQNVLEVGLFKFSSIHLNSIIKWPLRQGYHVLSIS